MSREGSDFSYKLKKGTTASGTRSRQTDRSQRVARVDYTEIYSCSESEGTLDGVESSRPVRVNCHSRSHRCGVINPSLLPRSTASCTEGCGDQL